jgi:NADH-quinone oxidoreductase subunit F
VRKPGVYELPMGISLRDLVEKYGEGTRSGKRIKAVIPGGVTAPMFPESQLDINMDFDSLAAAGSMLGSGAVIVMDETTCMVKVARRIMEFFYHESCGKCTPCREGLEWLVKILRRLEGGQGRSDDVQQLEELCTNIFGNTFCPLGDGAVMALRGALKHFPEEFSYHAEKRDCVVNSGVLG